jgi:hypothetical protein
VIQFGWLPANDEMIPLDDWNAARRQYWADTREAVLHPELFANGLMCPMCGRSMYDTNMVVSVSPTIMRVKCHGCGYRAERYT